MSVLGVRQTAQSRDLATSRDQWAAHSGPRDSSTPRHPDMALPACMIGDFQMETSEGFNDFMYELGVNFVTRNIANNLYPLQQIRQDPADEMISLGNKNKNNKQTIIVHSPHNRDPDQLPDDQDRV